MLFRTIEPPLPPSPPLGAPNLVNLSLWNVIAPEAPLPAVNLSLTLSMN